MAGTARTTGRVLCLHDPLGSFARLSTDEALYTLHTHMSNELYRALTYQSILRDELNIRVDNYHRIWYSLIDTTTKTHNPKIQFSMGRSQSNRINHALSPGQSRRLFHSCSIVNQQREKLEQLQFWLEQTWDGWTMRACWRALRKLVHLINEASAQLGIPVAGCYNAFRSTDTMNVWKGEQALKEAQEILKTLEALQNHSSVSMENPQRYLHIHPGAEHQPVIVVAGQKPELDLEIDKLCNSEVAYPC